MPPIAENPQVRLDSRLERRLLKIPQRPDRTWLGDRRPTGAVVLGEPMAVTIWMDEASEYILCADPGGAEIPTPAALFAAFVKGVLHRENGIPAARPGRVAVGPEFLEPLRDAMSRLGVELVALSHPAVLDEVFEEMEADLSGAFELIGRLSL